MRRRIAASGVCLLLFMPPLLAPDSDPIQTRYGAVQGFWGLGDLSLASYSCRDIASMRS